MTWRTGFYIFSIFTSALSTILSFIACFLNYIYSSSKISQFHTLVTLLLLCDGFGSFSFVIWSLVDAVVDDQSPYICQTFIPIPTYFFLMGFGWTSLIAHRFYKICHVHVQKTRQVQEELSLWIVPIICFLLVLPMIILNSIGIDVSETIAPAAGHDLDFCFFSSNKTAFYVNLITFQLPCLFTVFYNIRCFRLGMKSLQSSPERVVERESNRARKYLLVLLLTWVPNLLVNLYHSIFLPPHKDPYFPVQALVILTSFQGFINFFVYLWGYKPFTIWFSSFGFSFFSPLLGGIDETSSERSSLLNGLLLMGDEERDNEKERGRGKEGESGEGDEGEDERDDGDYENLLSHSSRHSDHLHPQSLSPPPIRSILRGNENQKDSFVSTRRSAVLSALSPPSEDNRMRIASGEKAVRFETKHEMRYYDQDGGSEGERKRGKEDRGDMGRNPFMPSSGYYPDEPPPPSSSLLPPTPPSTHHSHTVHSSSLSPERRGGRK